MVVSSMYCATTQHCNRCKGCTACSTSALLLLCTLLVVVYQWSDVLMLMSCTSSCIAMSVMSTGGVTTSWLYMLLAVSSLFVWVWGVLYLCVTGRPQQLISSTALHGNGYRLWLSIVITHALGLPVYWYGIAKMELAATALQGLHTYAVSYTSGVSTSCLYYW